MAHPDPRRRSADRKAERLGRRGIDAATSGVEDGCPSVMATTFTYRGIGCWPEKTLPLPLREGAGGGVISHGYCVQPLPPTLVRFAAQALKGRGRSFCPAATCECRSPIMAVEDPPSTTCCVDQRKIVDDLPAQAITVWVGQAPNAAVIIARRVMGQAQETHGPSERRNAFHRVLACLGVLSIAACAVGPDYKAPELPDKAGFTSAPLPARTTATNTPDRKSVV